MWSWAIASTGDCFYSTKSIALCSDLRCLKCRSDLNRDRLVLLEGAEGGAIDLTDGNGSMGNEGCIIF